MIRFPLLPKGSWLKRSSERAKFPKSSKQPTGSTFKPTGWSDQTTNRSVQVTVAKEKSYSKPTGWSSTQTNRCNILSNRFKRTPTGSCCCYLSSEKKRKCTNRFTTHDQPVRQAFQPVGGVHQPVHQSLQMMIKKMTRYRALTNRFNR